MKIVELTGVFNTLRNIIRKKLFEISQHKKYATKNTKTSDYVLPLYMLYLYHIDSPYEN